MKIALIICLLINMLSAQDKAIKIFTIGDSTMADKENPNINPERGWAQMLPNFFNENITIENHAVNGRSSKSFRDLGHWQEVLSELKMGDYVIIQFGHNDSKTADSTRFTNPHTTYRHNLIRYIHETKNRGAIPILCSSIVRRKFNEYGVLIDTHGAYPLETRLLAREMNITFIDLQLHSELLETRYGVEGSKKLHLHFKPGENEYFPEGKEDNTHLSVLGANEIAGIFVNEIQKLDHHLAAFLREL